MKGVAESRKVERGSAESRIPETLRLFCLPPAGRLAQTLALEGLRSRAARGL